MDSALRILFFIAIEKCIVMAFRPRQNAWYDIFFRACIRACTVIITLDIHEYLYLNRRRSKQVLEVMASIGILMTVAEGVAKWSPRGVPS